MKLAKIAFICAAAASLTVAAEDVSSTIGILRVEKSLTAMPLTVNFTDSNGNALTADKVVKTAGLPSSSALYVYDKATSAYTKYTLNGTAWERTNDGKKYVVGSDGQMTASESLPASDVTVARGAAVFLETPSGSADLDFYLAGTPGSGTETQITEGANLIGAPTAADFDLNSNTATWETIRASTFTSSGNKVKTKGDIIQVTTGDNGSTINYYYKGTPSTNGGEGEQLGWVKAVTNGDTTTYTNVGCVIPAGKGFWYIRKSGAGSMTITW